MVDAIVSSHDVSTNIEDADAVSCQSHVCDFKLVFRFFFFFCSRCCNTGAPMCRILMSTTFLEICKMVFNTEYVL